VVIVFDAARERNDVQQDIAILHNLTDAALDRGALDDDLLLQACATILAEKRRRLVELEQIALFVSKKESVEQ
jgi:hypothetical protein